MRNPAQPCGMMSFVNPSVYHCGAGDCADRSNVALNMTPVLSGQTYGSTKDVGSRAVSLIATASIKPQKPLDIMFWSLPITTSRPMLKMPYNSHPPG